LDIENAMSGEYEKGGWIIGLTDFDENQANEFFRQFLAGKDLAFLSSKNIM